MAGGRPRKSTATHKLEGTYRKDRHEGIEIKFNPAKEIPLPEQITNERTIAVWNQIIPALCEKGLVSIVEVPVLINAFENYQYAQQCDEQIQRAGGIVAYLSLIDYKSKDLTKYKEMYMKSFENIMFKFGVTPAESPKVRLAAKKEEYDDHEITDLIGRG